MASNREQQMNAVVMQASGPPAQALAVRAEPVPEAGEFNPSEIYDHDRHVTGLASVFIDRADGAHIFGQLALLFDRGLLTRPATKA
jgi:hypothetical protein